MLAVYVVSNNQRLTYLLY